MEKIRAQYTLFFSNTLKRDKATSVAEFIRDNNTHLHKIINLPTPSEISNIPWSKIESNQGVFVDLSGSRIDFVMEGAGLKMEEDIKTTIVELMREKDSFLFYVNRISNVSLISIEEADPNNFIKDKFFKKEFDKEYLDMQVRFNERFSEGDFSFNNIETHQVATVQNLTEGDGVQQPVVLITKDINTIHDISKNYSVDDINSFFQITDKKIASFIEVA